MYRSFSKPRLINPDTFFSSSIKSIFIHPVLQFGKVSNIFQFTNYNFVIIYSCPVKSCVISRS
ncbi:hypothetical protein EYV94_27310 [Puteibacter caeruleilacunae]|nr:hypothetical protein EYV94_27310 [Puteibacter caeruleilacunae]